MAKFGRGGFSWPSLALTWVLPALKARVARICSYPPCLSVSALASVEEVFEESWGGGGAGGGERGGA